MNYTKRMLSLLLSVLVLVTVLAGCGEKEEEQAMTISVPEGVSTLDPAQVTTDTEKIVVHHLYENLMKVSGNGEGGTQVVNGVARNYQSEDNLDGTQTYTFTLRNDVVWSDGQPVTADDFVYAWRRLADPDTKSPHAELLNMVKGYKTVRKTGNVKKLAVKAVDEDTFEVVLSHRCPYFVDQICTSFATMPVRKDAVKKDNWSMNAETLLLNGPYQQVREWDEDSILVDASEDYYDYRRLGPNSLDFLFYEEENADFSMNLSDEVVATMPESWSPDPYPQTGALLLNQMSRSVADKDLRQAMAMVIDRKAITELLNSRRYVPAEGLLPFGIKSTEGKDFRATAGACIDNNPANYTSNCDKARELLKGKKLPTNIKLSYFASSDMETVATELQRVWNEELHLSVQLQPMGRKEIISAMHKGDFAVALVPLGTDRSDASGMLDHWRSGAKENWANLHNSAFDTLMRISDASTSAEARDAYLADSERLLLDSGYLMPLYHVNQTARLADGLTGLAYDGMGCYYFSGVVKQK